MSYGTKWAIRAAVFGLVLHLLLTSAIICIIILVAKNVSLAKSIATITPFSVHALEFLAAVSLLRTKRMNNPFIEKCTVWLTSAKYLSPCIIIEEGILISWEFHLGIVAVVGVSYAVAVGLVTNSLRLKCACAETERRTEARNRHRDRMQNTTAREAFQRVDTGAWTTNAVGTGSYELSTAPARLILAEAHPAVSTEDEYETDENDDVIVINDEDDEDYPLPPYEDDNESPLPSYEDALRLLLSQFEAEDSAINQDDPPPCYDDVLRTDMA